MESNDIKTALFCRAIYNRTVSRKIESESEIGIFCASRLYSNLDCGVLVLGLNSSYKIITSEYVKTMYLDDTCSFFDSMEYVLYHDKVKYVVISVPERSVEHYRIPYLASFARECFNRINDEGKCLLRFFAITGFQYENLI